MTNMKVERTILVEIKPTQFGVVKVEEVTIITSDYDVFNHYYEVSVNNDIKHHRCDSKDAILALCQYIT